MLILSRKRGQTVVINDNITVTVLETVDGKVRLGIAAPRSVPVHRREIHEAIHGPLAAELVPSWEDAAA